MSSDPTVVSSPQLLRPMAHSLGSCPLFASSAVEPRIAEVPGPPASALSREEWLRRALIAEWPELIALGKTLQDRYDCTLTSWRAGVLEVVRACPHDAVIFSHFVPVNVLTGHATSSQRVACFLPDHTSVTVFETAGDEIRGRARPRIEAEGQLAPRRAVTNARTV